MAVDLESAPWNRLARLAPTGTAEEDLQEAGDRYETNDDVMAAAADLWEEYAMTLDLPTATDVTSQSIGDVSVTRAGAVGALAAAVARVNYFRMRSNVYTVDFKERDVDLADEAVDYWTEA